MFRSMRRFKQQLSEAECLALLKRLKRGTLAVLGDDGYPYAVPVDFVYDESDHTLNFHGAKEGHKIDAIRRCDKVSFNVYDEGTPDEEGYFLYFNSVTVFGRMREVTDPAEKTAKLRLLGNKYFPTAAFTEEEIRKDGGRANCLVLKIEYMTGKHVHER